jgi:hypothetical protein
MYDYQKLDAIVTNSVVETLFASAKFLVTVAQEIFNSK